MKDLQAAFDRLQREAPQALSQIVKDAAVEILRQAVLKAPVETGHLRESGNVDFGGSVVARGSKGGGVSDAGAPPTPTGTSITARIGFNATAPNGKVSYAQIQHERMDFNHPIGGEAKYLEKAVNETRDKVMRMMQTDFNAFVERFK